MDTALHILTRVIEDSKKYLRHPQQDDYDKLLFGEYVFTVKKVQEHVPAGGTVLDVGTAYGTVPVALRRMGYNVYATDMNRLYLASDFVRAEGVKFKKNNIEKEDLVIPELVDCVIFTEVLEHLNAHPLKAIERLKKALKPGGVLILTTPDFQRHGKAPGRYGKLFSWEEFPESVEDWRDEHTHHYHHLELVHLITKAGLTLKETGICYDEQSHYIVATA